jgi:PST family polysaccharide transporter
LSSVLAISLALNGFGYWSLVAREVSRAGFYLIGTFWYVRWLPTLPIRFNGLSQHIRLGTNMSLAFIITAISGKIDSVLVGKFFGATDLGLFRQAQGLIVAPMEQFNAPIFNVAQPALSALQSQGPRYRRYYERMTGFIAMITMPLGVLVAVYAEEITLLLLGAKWADAAPFVRYFALAMALRPTLHSCTMVLVTLGRTTPLIWLELANNLLFVFFIVLGMSFGAVGAAFAFMAVTILFAPIRVHFSFKGTPVTAAAMFAASRVPICATAAMGIALLVASQITRAVQFRHGLAIGVLVAAFAYGAAWLLVPGGVSEFRRLVHDVGEAVRHRRSKASSS